MNFLKIAQEKMNVLLFVLISLFFLMPALQDVHPIIPISPFVFFFILVLSLRAGSLKMKTFWQSILLVAIGFFLDLILAFITTPLLERVLIVSVHGIYILILGLSIKMIIKKLMEQEDDVVNIFKSGICGYLLIGLLWAVLYSFTYWINRANFSTYELGQIPFFYFSYSVLTSLKFSGVFPVTTWAISLAYLEIISGQIFLIIFVARMAAIFIKKQNIFR
ncbi:MAG: hypothetical protein PHY73_04685 [Candidatus Omnitrophica bacterium]|nr:hypothetical protein [Candidatus Omnitrophota bacterium]